MSETLPSIESVETGVSRTPRILVVDDVEDNRDILTRRLTRRGFEVIEAAGGAAALDVLARETIDLVLLDIMMPDITGNEVLRQLRETRSQTDLPVIMVSAKSESEDVVESIQLGANDYVTKPVDFAIALARIRAQLERKNEADAAKLRHADVNRQMEELGISLDEQRRSLEKVCSELAEESDGRRHSEARLQYLAYHDSLTGLANRVAFRRQLRSAFEGTSDPLVLIFIDLDRFKHVNDFHGHGVGDQLLNGTAERLRAIVKDEAMIARLGGDEFAVLLERCGAEEGQRLGETIVEAMGRPFTVGDKHLQIGASCGLAMRCEGIETIDDLISAADLAMYHAKEAGRNASQTFEPRMFEEYRRRQALRIDLSEAVRDGAMEIHYQPLVKVETNQIVAFEALLRWNHPRFGPISPDTFIPIAEEHGLIGTLGGWVLRQACQEATNWPDHIRIAVNLSPVQFQSDGLVPTIVSALATSGLTPSRLELEITETALLQGFERNHAMLNAIRELGCRISMDDFGTGYSSMSYLQSFRFDKIKIDRRFINLGENASNNAAIVSAIVSLSAQIGTDTTAEGIETLEQLKSIVAQGCIEAQGFYFSRPMKGEDIASFLSEAACADA